MTLRVRYLLSAVLLALLGLGAAPPVAQACMLGCAAPVVVVQPVYQSCSCCSCGTSYYPSTYAAYAYPSYGYGYGNNYGCGTCAAAAPSAYFGYGYRHLAYRPFGYRYRHFAHRPFVGRPFVGRPFVGRPFVGRRFAHR
jgi:hypothetical protein